MVHRVFFSWFFYTKMYPSALPDNHDKCFRTTMTNASGQPWQMLMDHHDKYFWTTMTNASGQSWKCFWIIMTNASGQPWQMLLDKCFWITLTNATGQPWQILLDNYGKCFELKANCCSGEVAVCSLLSVIIWPKFGLLSCVPFKGVRR